MSSTRHAKPGSPSRQERYASSPEYERGLRANLVAKRCSVLKHPEDRELILALQNISHQDGGLDALAKELLARYPERFQTEDMTAIGKRAGLTYTSDEVRQVRDGFPSEIARELPLRGEAWSVYGGFAPVGAVIDQQVLNSASGLAELRHSAASAPSRYEVETLASLCRDAAGSALTSEIEALCLNPSRRVSDVAPWYCPDLVTLLREHLAARTSDGAAGFASTSVATKVHEAMDYARSMHCLVIVDGQARIGKSFAAQRYCQEHPGRARYVECPPGNDDAGFFRAIARSLGVSTNLNLKAQQIRDRVEESLLGGDLVLVLDEAHRLFAQKNVRFTLPVRLNWVMTMVNQGVGFCLVVTPQFFKAQATVERATYWTSEQFTGRIGHYEKLPDFLNLEELEGVARALLPEGCERSIKTLVAYADSSAKYLAGIEHAVRRARYLAQREGHLNVNFRAVQTAIKQGSIPSDAALAETLAALEPKAGRRRSARAMQPVSGVAAESLAMSRSEAGDAASEETLETSFPVPPRGDLGRVARRSGDLVEV